MTLQIDIPIKLEKELQTLIFATLKQAVQELQQQNQSKEWMSQKEGAAYAGVLTTHSLSSEKWGYGSVKLME